MSKERFSCLIAVALLLKKGNQCLLMRRANTGFGDGFWGLPGGSLEGNEPMRQALVREAKEEIGIDIDPEKLHYLTSLHISPHFRTPKEVIMFCFIAEEWTGEITNCEPHKCDAIEFFPFDQVPENCLEGSRRCIDNYLNSKNPFSELHW